MRTEAAYDRYFTVLRVHPGDAILTDNWHTNEVLSHARNNFEGVTFAMRTLEAWGAMIENDQPRLLHRGRANLDDGSRALRRKEAAAARHRPGQEVGRLRRILLIDDTPEIAELSDVLAA